jgi:hypothetical protein
MIFFQYAFNAFLTQIWRFLFFPRLSGHTDANLAVESIRVARFLLPQYTKAGKTYEITVEYTEWPQNIPNCHKRDQNVPF